MRNTQRSELFLMRERGLDLAITGFEILCGCPLVASRPLDTAHDVEGIHTVVFGWVVIR